MARIRVYDNIGDPYPVGGETIDAKDIIIKVDVKDDCTDCDAVGALPDWVCNPGDRWCCQFGESSTQITGGSGLSNCNNKPYSEPVRLGDCLYFQFQFQNTLNGFGSQSFATYLQGGQSIPYGWYHSTLNPVSSTVRIRMIDASTGNIVPDLVFEPLIRQASVFLRRDDDASIGYPFQAWYRWYQNVRICLPQSQGSIPDEFYFRIDVTKFDSTVSTFYSQSYKIDEYCESCDQQIHEVEGVWDTLDCNKAHYGQIPLVGSIPVFTQNDKPPIILGVNTLTASPETAHRDLIRILATFRKSDASIDKEMEDDSCVPTRTIMRFSYDFRTNDASLPPYQADRLVNIFTAPKILIDGATQVYAQGLKKNNDVSDMWDINETLTGCPCVIDSGCP